MRRDHSTLLSFISLHLRLLRLLDTYFGTTLRLFSLFSYIDGITLLFFYDFYDRLTKESKEAAGPSKRSRSKSPAAATTEELNEKALMTYEPLYYMIWGAWNMFFNRYKNSLLTKRHLLMPILAVTLDTKGFEIVVDVS